LLFLLHLPCNLTFLLHYYQRYLLFPYNKVDAIELFMLYYKLFFPLT